MSTVYWSTAGTMVTNTVCFKSSKVYEIRKVKLTEAIALSKLNSMKVSFSIKKKSLRTSRIGETVKGAVCRLKSNFKKLCLKFHSEVSWANSGILYSLTNFDILNQFKQWISCLLHMYAANKNHDNSLSLQWTVAVELSKFVNSKSNHLGTH